MQGASESCCWSPDGDKRLGGPSPGPVKSAWSKACRFGRLKLIGDVKLGVSRPGAFAANFAPGTLDRFRELCKQQGRQYTKVLERLAELYLETGGAVLDGTVTLATPAPDAKKRQVQVESLQNKLLEDLLKRVEWLEKQKVKNDYELERLQKGVAFLRSGLQEPGGF